MRSLLILLSLLAGPAMAQMLPMQDPYLNTDHYQTDITIPVQDQLDDCFLFEAETWQQPIDSITRTALWHCRAIARSNAIGVPLSDSQQALSALLLAYEAEARRWSIHSLTRGSISSYDDPDAGGTYTGRMSLILASNWAYMTRIQEETRATLGLDLVLETYN